MLELGTQFLRLPDIIDDVNLRDQLMIHSFDRTEKRKHIFCIQHIITTSEHFVRITNQATTATTKKVVNTYHPSGLEIHSQLLKPGVNPRSVEVSEVYNETATGCRTRMNGIGNIIHGLLDRTIASILALFCVFLT